MPITEAMRDELAARQAHFLEAVEAELRRVLEVPHPQLAHHYGMMHYHLGWADEHLQPAQGDTGKRLRPLLCLEACFALGGDWRRALPAAAALELLHNFSLIHDDIEDRSDLRRGRATVWKLWGVPLAVNVGDGMFSLAHLTVQDLLTRGVPVRQVLQASRMFSQTCVALTEGQFLDMDMEDRLDVDLDQYLWMIRNKTAVLLGTSTGMGALLAGAPDDVIAACQRFGEQVGMAFQIVDDILGTWGDEAVTGKSAYSDVRDRKKTYPVAYALDLLARVPDAPEAEPCRRLRELYSRPLSERDVEEVLSIFQAIHAREQAEEAAEGYYQMALAHLREAGLDEDRAPGLWWLASRLVHRKR
ncbi:MAG: polyprenyl synthetase family protein [Anaerolineae bacterium]|nr:polyprenyl synthetase family protein [Anaerolineae bacterium]